MTTERSCQCIELQFVTVRMQQRDLIIQFPVGDIAIIKLFRYVDNFEDNFGIMSSNKGFVRTHQYILLCVIFGTNCLFVRFLNFI